jgi:hypothetical protein
MMKDDYESRSDSTQLAHNLELDINRGIETVEHYQAAYLPTEARQQGASYECAGRSLTKTAGSVRGDSPVVEYFGKMFRISRERGHLIVGIPVSGRKDRFAYHATNMIHGLDSTRVG